MIEGGGDYITKVGKICMRKYRVILRAADQCG